MAIVVDGFEHSECVIEQSSSGSAASYSTSIRAEDHGTSIRWNLSSSTGYKYIYPTFSGYGTRADGSTAYYWQVFSVYFTTLPSAQATILWSNAATNPLQIDITSTGAIKIIVGSTTRDTSTVTLSTGKWYQFGVYDNAINSGACGYAVHLQTGEMINTVDTTHESSASAPTRWAFGIGDTCTTDIYFDSFISGMESSTVVNPFAPTGPLHHNGGKVRVATCVPQAISLGTNASGSYTDVDEYPWATDAVHINANGGWLNYVYNWTLVSTVRASSFYGCGSFTMLRASGSTTNCAIGWRGDGGNWAYLTGLNIVSGAYTYFVYGRTTDPDGDAFTAANIYAMGCGYGRDAGLDDIYDNVFTLWVVYNEAKPPPNQVIWW